MLIDIYIIYWVRIQFYFVHFLAHIVSVLSSGALSVGSCVLWQTAITMGFFKKYFLTFWCHKMLLVHHIFPVLGQLAISPKISCSPSWDIIRNQDLGARCSHDVLLRLEWDKINKTLNIIGNLGDYFSGDMASFQVGMLSSDPLHHSLLFRVHKTFFFTPIL